MPDQPVKQIDTLLSARWIAPILPKRTLLNDYAIAIDKGCIIELLPASEAQQRYTADNTHTFDDHVLMPGLINAHGHAAMSLFRGMADDYPLQEWLDNHIWPAEGRWVDEDFVRDGTQLAIAEMLRSGTTTFSDMYFFPDMAASAAIEAGIRAQLSFPIFEFPSSWGQGPDEYIRKGLQVRDDFKHSDLVNIVFGPHAPYTVGDEAMKRIAMLGAELDTHIQIHCHETAAEVDTEAKQTSKRPLQRLNDLGLLTPKTQLVHMTALNDDDIELVANAGSHVIHCPESNLKLASGFCPVSKLTNAGINVALGTDGAASNNDLNLFGEMKTAALLAKMVANDASFLGDWDALEMATLSGAKALGIDDKVGSLEPGKEADIIAINLNELEQQPVFDPVSQLVYTDVGNQVSDSWVKGVQVLADRQPININLQDCIARAQQWRDKIQSDSN